MKVIGLCGNYSDKVIAEISIDEINKVLNKSYSDPEKVKNLQPGAEINLGAGHDFRYEIGQVCYQMQNAMSSFERARSTLSNFAALVATLPKQEPPQ